MLSLGLFLKEWTDAWGQTVKRWLIFYHSLHRGTKQQNNNWILTTGNLPRRITFHNSNDKTSPLNLNWKYHSWQSFWFFVKLGWCQLQCSVSDFIVSQCYNTRILIRAAVFCWAGLDTTTQLILTTKTFYSQDGFSHILYMSDSHCFISLILFH